MGRGEGEVATQAPVLARSVSQKAGPSHTKTARVWGVELSPEQTPDALYELSPSVWERSEGEWAIAATKDITAQIELEGYTSRSYQQFALHLGELDRREIAGAEHALVASLHPGFGTDDYEENDGVCVEILARDETGLQVADCQLLIGPEITRVRYIQVEPAHRRGGLGRWILEAIERNYGDWETTDFSEEGAELAAAVHRDEGRDARIDQGDAARAAL